MSFQLQNPFSTTKCFHHLLFSIIYVSISVLLVFLGVVWCSSTHAQHLQQLPNNLQNHRLTVESPASAESKDVRVSTPLEIEQSPPPMRRSYQSSGYGSGSDYSNQFGSQSGQYPQQSSYQQQQGYNQQQYGQYPQSMGSSARQFDPSMMGGGYYPQVPGSIGAFPGFGLENRFLSLFPRRSFGYQPYYPFGSYGSSSYYPNYGQSQFGSYPMSFGGAYGPLTRLAQLTGLTGYKGRLAPDTNHEEVLTP